MIHEVFAIRYAELRDRQPSDLFIGADPHDGPRSMDYFVWLLRAGERLILVDTGFSETDAAERGRKLLVRPDEALRRFGAPPEAITDVIVTHLHYDHAGNLDRFPKARFHIQDREMRFATGRCMCHRLLRYPFTGEHVVQMVRHLYAERVVFHDGEGEVAPGVNVHHIGGHTDGLQAVTVATARGEVVLASDATHYYANLGSERPFPIVYHLGDMLDGWRKLRVLAGGDMERIVPGHDPLVRAVYPDASRNGVDAAALHLPPLRPAAELWR
jgi:glyoxylase-like metal-dependent hydrolase (beta-lactamase superfamily II)